MAWWFLLSQPCSQHVPSGGQIRGTAFTQGHALFSTCAPTITLCGLQGHLLVCGVWVGNSEVEEGGVFPVWQAWGQGAQCVELLTKGHQWDGPARRTILQTLEGKVGIQSLGFSL